MLSYFYDIPYYLALTKPVPIVSDWQNTTVDNWRKELADGAAFEPAKARDILWTKEMLQQRIEHKVPLVIVTESNASTDSLQGMQPAYQAANTDIYVVN